MNKFVPISWGYDVIGRIGIVIITLGLGRQLM